MSAAKAYCDTHRLIGMEGDPALTVRPWPVDPTGTLELLAHGADAEAHFGRITVAMPPDMAAKLGQALIDAAREMTGGAS